MPKKKKIETDPVEEPIAEEKVPKKQSDAYKTYKDLSEDELDIILLYEEHVARMLGKYITEFDSKKIKEKYGNCTFPPFVLRMMQEVVKHC